MISYIVWYHKLQVSQVTTKVASNSDIWTNSTLNDICILEYRFPLFRNDQEKNRGSKVVYLREVL